MLGIAAGILGAGAVVGLDVDSGALATAAENAESMEVDLDFVCCDVARTPCEPGNPIPFGSCRQDNVPAEGAPGYSPLSDQRVVVP